MGVLGVQMKAVWCGAVVECAERLLSAVKARDVRIGNFKPSPKANLRTNEREAS